MSVIYGFLILVEAVVSALLIGVIFLQKTKGGMGGTAFGGGMGEAIFGSRMGNVLTKSTVVLGIIFLANTVLLTMLTARHQSAGSVMYQVPIQQTSMPQPPPIAAGTDSMPVPTDMPIAANDAEESAPVEAFVDMSEPEGAATAPAE